MSQVQIPPSELVNIAELHVDAQNPNRMTRQQHEALRQSIERYGFIVPIITNKDLLIADGEQRWTVAKSMGMAQVPVIRLPIEDVDRRLLRQVLNKLRGEHELIADAHEFDLIINAGHEQDLKDLLLLNDSQIERYLISLHEPQIEPNGLNIALKDAKLLNLYAGIGGNRRFWKDLNVTAIENNEEIAKAYQTFFPNDKVIITDAHKYLEENFDKYDFIWSSPPCPTHSQMRKNFGNNKPVYSDMRLYEEILLLQGYFEGKWVVENVRSWYEPLIEPKTIGRHYFWTNFEIPFIEVPLEIISIDRWNDTELKNNHAKALGFDPDIIPDFSTYPKDKIIRNCVHPLIGEHILNAAFSKN